MAENDSLRSFYSTLKQTGPEWDVRVPPQNIQIVAKTHDWGYNALTHRVPSNGTGYFNMSTAYNDLYPRMETGYRFVNRHCDGTYVSK